MFTEMITSQKHSSNQGFTLIELLVATTIILLMVGFGIASFLDFNDRQILVTNAKELQSYLRTAQIRARAGDRPTGCSSLKAYSIRLTANSQAVQQYAICDNGDILRDTYQLDPGVVTQQALNISFLGLHGGVTGEGIVVLESSNGLEYQFEITQGGEITEGGLVENPQ